MIRDIITIDEERCTGCGECIPGCPEGALQMIDGKARLVSDLSCDGLGACIGECPVGALSVERREADPYDEVKVMARIIAQGPNTIRAHLAHLLDHGEAGYHRQACEALMQAGLDPEDYRRQDPVSTSGCAAGCPGSRIMGLFPEAGESSPPAAQPSKLRQWPVQMHLISPGASYFKGADLLLAADCVAYAMGDFHTRLLDGKSLVVACPKLDSNQEDYLQKLTALIDDAEVRSITIAMMEVPCCGGLVQLVRRAMGSARRSVPVKVLVIGVKGDILSTGEYSL